MLASIKINIDSNIVNYGLKINCSIMDNTQKLLNIKMDKQNGTYVVSGYDGYVACSSDLITWTSTLLKKNGNTDITNTIEGLYYDDVNNRFIATGYDGFVAYINAPSNNNNWGNIWNTGWNVITLDTNTVNGDNVKGEMTTICCGTINDTYYCLLGGNDSEIFYSSTFPNTFSGTHIFNKVAITGESLSLVTIRSIIYIPEKEMFVAVCSGGRIFYTTDIINWTESMTGITSSLHEIYYNSENNLYVAVGGDGNIIYTKSLTDSVISSWNTAITGTNAVLQSIAYDPIHKVYVAVGLSGTILITDDVSKWIQVDLFILDDLQKVIYDNSNNTFAIVGKDVVIKTSSPTVLTRPKKLDDELKVIYPMGSRIHLFEPNNPQNYLGFGTWTRVLTAGDFTYTRIL